MYIHGIRDHFQEAVKSAYVFSNKIIKQIKHVILIDRNMCIRCTSEVNSVSNERRFSQESTVTASGIPQINNSLLLIIHHLLN